MSEQRNLTITRPIYRSTLFEYRIGMADFATLAMAEFFWMIGLAASFIIPPLNSYIIFMLPPIIVTYLIVAAITIKEPNIGSIIATAMKSMPINSKLKNISSGKRGKKQIIFYPD